jgi:hypothetical protein
MGILDDAIREHLELKRSHGATDDEIRRKEAEVFGPVRPDAAPAADVALDEPTRMLAPDDAAAPAEPADAPDHLDMPTQAHPGPDLDAPTEAHPGPDLPSEDTHYAEPAPADLDALEPVPEDPYEVHPGDSLVPDPEEPPARRHEHHEDEQHPALIDHDHIGGEEHPPEPVFRQAPPEPGPEPEAAEPEPADGEDMLEETPEFLQDAPEHDRLWFEQKPPRDFDFGE